jgi:hypothetical protein
MRLLLALLAALSVSADISAADVPTQMTVRGKEIYSQDFLNELPPYTGKPKGFASGFQGWLIHGKGPESKGGMWKILEGRFQGHENVQVKHPATASYGFLFKNVVIQCELRMEDVALDKDPAHGAKYRYIQLRTTDDKDYICSVAFRRMASLSRRTIMTMTALISWRSLLVRARPSSPAIGAPCSSRFWATS